MYKLKSVILLLKQLFEAFFYTRNMEEILISGGIIGLHLLYMFCANYGSQVMTNHFDDIFSAAYVAQF